MRINHNIPALKANNSLGRTTGALDKSLERLSSGYRINRSADDAAGMAISQKMKTQIAGLNQASRNASDGISVIQIAEGALQEVESMAQRMRELSVQAANGTNTDSDREAIQQEINQLNEEIDRISVVTEFNTMPLLDGNLNCQSYSNVDTVEMVSLSDNVDSGEWEVIIIQDTRPAVISGIQFGAYDEVIESSGTININGCAVEVHAGQTYGTLYSELRSTCDKMNIVAFIGSEGADPEDDEAIAGYTQENAQDGGELILASRGYGSKYTIEVYCDNEELRDLFGFADGYGVEAQGVDVEGTIGESGFSKTATASGDGEILSITDLDGKEMKLAVKPGTAGTGFVDASVGGTKAEIIDSGEEVPVVVTVLSAGPMDLQIGANEGQMMEVRIPEVSTKTLGLNMVNVGTQDGAMQAIALCDVAIDMVSAIRAKLGAYENRLDHAIANLKVSSENLTEALSRISDTDMAEEMTTYTQKNVLSQAGTSMLAQANERPQTILSLLQ